MSPSHATKRGRRYRYYVSQAILQGRKADAGAVARVPATELERRVVEAVRGAAPTDRRERSIETQIIRRVPDRPDAAIDSAALGSSPCALDPSDDLYVAVERITIRRATLEIQLAEGTAEDRPDRMIFVPWTPPSPYRRREIIQGQGEQSAAVRPMRTKARGVLIDALRDDHRWLDELTTDSSHTIESIAAREKKTERSIRLTMSLAFLSPALVKAAIDGRAAARLRRQTADGPSDHMVGSVVRARSQGARVGRIETRSAQPIIRRTQVSIRDRGRRQVVRRWLPHHVQPAHLGNGILRPETSPSRSGARGRTNPPSGRRRPCSALLTLYKVARSRRLGNHRRSRGLPGGERWIRTRDTVCRTASGKGTAPRKAA